MSPVLTWLEGLRWCTPAVPHLSAPGARIGLDTALDALVGVEAHFDAPAPEHTVFVASRTVFTAPLEWIAVLLGRGGRVTLKAPTALLPWFEQLRAPGLALEITADRSVLTDADLVVAMGSDRTIAALQAQVTAPLLGFGSRYSVAWWTDPASADALALDLTLHDGRGCMSPVAIFSPLPDAAMLLHAALERLGARIPRGTLGAAEAARIRERVALARVLGSAHTGTEHAVLQLPLDRLQLDGLPRVAVVHPCTDAQQLTGALVDPRISVIGTDAPLQSPYRTTPLGTMQAPPLDRLHDGVDWLRALEPGFTPRLP